MNIELTRMYTYYNYLLINFLRLGYYSLNAVVTKASHVVFSQQISYARVYRSSRINVDRTLRCVGK